MKKLLFAIIGATLFSATVVGQTSYTLDKYHSRVNFSATHFGISHVEGNFKIIDATLVSKKADLTDAVITFKADVNSINTEVEYRDKDLKSANYFDAAKYPELTFKSTSFRKVAGKNYLLSGNMTIHGVTKPVVLRVIFNGTAITAMKKLTAGFTLSGFINRVDFGVGGDPLTSGVSNKIDLTANVEFTITK
ncbi:YceI family protein [Arcticibacter eurypsychrophilus]|uniref:YceI family protein n=1 Tax=Arcticibacter eurypsychrophilus TaxID=1434752 RepID=UPI00084D8141|nr:YceI family protein [Arcticibacter eurypsychrophilus]